MKTYEEIIKYHMRASEDLKAPNCDGTYEDSELIREAIAYHELVVEACEKQVAQKVDISPYNIKFCPVCKGSVWQIKHESKYCFRCGQKIYWSDKK